MNDDTFWKDFIRIYCKRIHADLMEEAVFDIIFEYFWLQWRVWDEEKFDDGLKIISDDGTTMTKVDRNVGGWDVKTGFAKGTASPFIDVRFKLRKYHKVSTVAFGICPIENYKKNRGRRSFDYFIGNEGWKGSVSFDVYKGNIAINGKNVVGDYNGKNGAKTGDVIRILLDNGHVQFFVNDELRHKAIQIDENVCFIPGVSMYVKGDEIDIVQK